MSTFPEAHSYNRRKWMLLASGLTVQALRGDEELRRLAPPTEKPLDPALLNLITRMRKIVIARDHVALQALMSPTFRVEFDVGKGPAAFRNQWHPESPSSAVWPLLDHLLSIPGYAYSNRLCVVPYVFARFPLDMDPLQHVVAVKEPTSLLAEPKPEAAKVASLDYAIIPLAKPPQLPVTIPPNAYLEVQHPTAGRCFAASADICHPAAHRAFFDKRGGQWQWISLAAATLHDPPELKTKGVGAG